MRAVLLERPRRGEFAEPVADHILGHEHRIKDFAVVHREGQADEIRA